MRRPFLAFALTLAGLFLPAAARAADRGTQFRGPNGTGIAAGAKGLPARWSEKTNIVWKTAIHGKGWSSPVVLGNQVWMTTATPDGKKMFAVCVDRESGKIIHDILLWEVAKPAFAHEF